MQPARKFPRRLNKAKLIRTTPSINSKSTKSKEKCFFVSLQINIYLLGRKKLGVTLCTWLRILGKRVTVEK